MIIRIINLLNYLRWIIVGRHFYSLSIDGYLKTHGYFLSSKLNSVVFSDGSPAPWLTYPFLDFFIPKLSKNLVVFEFGIGNSTLFFKNQRITAYGVEHDVDWFNKIISTAMRSFYFLAYNKEDYIKSIHIPRVLFDIVIIDGIYRDECLDEVLESISSRGVIVVDNCERHLEVKENLILEGYKYIDFWGLQALGYQSTCTSIFYKEGNCLSL